MQEIKTYTIMEVANILKVTRRTVYNYVTSGKIKAIKIGSQWRINDPDLKEFLNYSNNEGN